MSDSPAKNSVGVFTFDTSLIGEFFQNASMGAFFSHGVPPNHVRRNDVLSVCAQRDVQFATPAPAEPALNRSVSVTCLLTSGPPALQPITISLSGSATPICTRWSTPLRMSGTMLWK